MYRLLMRAFPQWYEYNSVYAMYPFTIPTENQKIFKHLGVASSYSFNPPKKPQDPFFFSTAANAKLILGNQKTFKVVWGEAISETFGRSGFHAFGG